MNSKVFGAVCDASVLGERSSFERTRQLLGGAPLYLPSATYSWLARDRLISVRGETIGYSLVSQFVRDRKLLIVYLPELLDELSRRLLFSSEREIPLTDLRAFMLSSHLEVPLFTLDDEPVQRVQDCFEGRKLLQMEVDESDLTLRDAIWRYSEFSSHVGNFLNQKLNERDAFKDLVEQVCGQRKYISKAVSRETRGPRQTASNPGRVKVEFVVWNLVPILREYITQHVLQQEVVRDLCGKSLLLVASPG